MINVVMLVHNRPEHTKQAIESLFAHTPRADFDLTIVDDKSAPLTGTVLEQFAARYPDDIRLVVNKQNRGVGWSRNRGIAEAGSWWGRGDYLYISDNDVYFTPGWSKVLTGVYPFAHDVYKVRVLGGYNHPFQQPLEEYGIGAYTIHTYNAVSTQSWLLRWDSWDRYGKFHDHARGVRQSEDWEWSQRVRGDGFEVASVIPHVIVNTGRTDSFGGKDPGAEHIPDIRGVNVV